MAEERSSSSQVQIILSIIGVVGTLGVAVIANWEKIFPKPPVPSPSISPTPAPTPFPTAAPRPSPRPFHLPPGPYYLKDHPELLIGQENILGRLQWGGVNWQDDVWIDGKTYKRALGMHAPEKGVGSAEFRITRGARYFRTVFGLARDDKNPDDYGDAQGRILIDGKEMWKMRVSSNARAYSVSIEIPRGAKVLRLEVDPLGANTSDHTTWGDPFFSAVLYQ